MEFNYDSKSWDVIDSYFKSNSNYLTNHHIESFNDFISNKIPIIISQYNPQILYKELNEETKEYKYEIQIFYGGKTGEKVYLGKPVIFGPNMKNVEDTVKILLGRGGLQCSNREDLFTYSKALLTNPNIRFQTGKLAQETVLSVKGASEKNAQIIINHLSF